MKKRWIALAVLLLTAVLAGCGASDDQRTELIGTTSCARAKKIKVWFSYYPAERRAAHFGFEMDLNKVRYIEGVDYPAGSNAWPQFVARGSLGDEEFTYTQGESFTAYAGGCALQIVEIGENYALGYVSFVKNETNGFDDRDGVGEVDFGVMDVVLTRDGRRKYIPDDWQARLHAYEVGATAAALSADESTARLLRVIGRIRDEGMTKAMKNYPSSVVPLTDAAAVFAKDASADAVDRACAYALLLRLGELSSAEEADVCYDILSLLSEAPEKALEIYNLLQYVTEDEDSYGGDKEFTRVIKTVMDAEGAQTVLSLLPDSRTLSVDSAARGYGQMIGDVASVFASRLEKYDMHAVVCGCAEKGYYRHALLSAYQKANGTVAALTLMRELAAMPAYGFGTGSDYEAFVPGFRAADGLDVTLDALLQVNALLPEAVSYATGLLSPMNVPSADEDARYDPARFAGDKLVYMEQGGVLPAGSKLPVLYENGELHALPQLLARKLCADNQPFLLDAERLPASAADVDILIVCYDSSEFYGTYTNGCEGYSTVTNVYAFDLTTGEQLAYLGKITIPPPLSFTSEPGGKYYESPDHNDLPLLIRDFLQPSVQ